MHGTAILRQPDRDRIVATADQQLLHAGRRRHGGLGATARLQLTAADGSNIQLNQNLNRARWLPAPAASRSPLQRATLRTSAPPRPIRRAPRRSTASHAVRFAEHPGRRRWQPISRRSALRRRPRSLPLGNASGPTNVLTVNAANATIAVGGFRAGDGQRLPEPARRHPEPLHVGGQQPAGDQPEPDRSRAAPSRMRTSRPETANLTKSQVLQQAGISVLAQANQQPQLILKLLQ